MFEPPKEESNLVTSGESDLLAEPLARQNSDSKFHFPPKYFKCQLFVGHMVDFPMENTSYS